MSNEVEQRLFLLLESIEQLRDTAQKKLDDIEYTRTQTAGITKYHHELESRLNSAVERIEDVRISAEKLTSPLKEPIEKAITDSIEKANKVERDRLNASIRNIDKSLQGVHLIVDEIENNYHDLLQEVAQDNKKFLQRIKNDCENSILSWKYLAVPAGVVVFSILCLLLVWVFIPTKADIAEQRKQMADAKEAFTMYVDAQKDIETSKIKHANGITYIKVNTGNCFAEQGIKPTKVKFCSVD